MADCSVFIKTKKKERKHAPLMTDVVVVVVVVIMSFDDVMINETHDQSSLVEKHW